MTLTVNTQSLPGSVNLRGALKTVDFFLDEGPVEGMISVSNIDFLQDRCCSTVSGTESVVVLDEVFTVLCRVCRTGAIQVHTPSAGHEAEEQAHQVC